MRKKSPLHNNSRRARITHMNDVGAFGKDIFPSNGKTTGNNYNHPLIYFIGKEGRNY